MPKTKGRYTRITNYRPAGLIETPSQEQNIRAALREVDSVVYGVRTFDQLIKIGYTANLRQRLNHMGLNRQNIADWLLFVVAGTLDDEQALHAALRSHLARGREYYHPHPEVLHVVHRMRSQRGADALAN